MVVESAPRNRVVISWNGPGNPVQALVFDQNGTQRDISAILVFNSGTTQQGTAGSASQELVLSRGGNTLNTRLNFQPLRKRLVYDVPESVINQILGMLEV